MFIGSIFFFDSFDELFELYDEVSFIFFTFFFLFSCSLLVKKQKSLRKILLPFKKLAQLFHQQAADPTKPFSKKTVLLLPNQM